MFSHAFLHYENCIYSLLFHQQLFNCHLLHRLSMPDNDLSVLPAAIANLINLRELDVSKNSKNISITLSLLLLFKLFWTGRFNESCKTIMCEFQKCCIWLRKIFFSRIVTASLANNLKATRKKNSAFIPRLDCSRDTRRKNATACFSLTTYYVTALHDLKFSIKKVGKLRPAAHETTSS